MDVPTHDGHYLKRGFTEVSEPRKGDANRYEEDDECENSEKKKLRSGKSRKHSNVDDSEDWEREAKGRASMERNESRGRLNGSTRADDFVEDDYDGRRELHSKMLRENVDFVEQVSHGSSSEKREKNDRKLGNGYSDILPETGKWSKDDVSSKKYGRLEEEVGARKLDDDDEYFDENDRQTSRKLSGKGSGQEGSWNKSRAKPEFSVGDQPDRTPDKLIKEESDERYSERKESSREKGQGNRSNKQDAQERERNPRRKWDEPDVARKAHFVVDDGYTDKEDSRGGKVSDKHEFSRERAVDARMEPIDTSPRNRSRYGASSHDKGDKAWTQASESKSVRSSGREDNRVESERSKTKGRWDSREEDNDDNRMVTGSREHRDDTRDDRTRRPKEKLDSAEDVELGARRLSYKVHGEKQEKYREHRGSTHGGHDDTESWERSVNTDDEGHTDKARLRNRRDSTWEDLDGRGRSGNATRSTRAVKNSRRSRSPEGSGHYRQDSEELERGFSDDRAESDNERSISFKGKDREREESRDDRSRGRGHGFSRNREWEDSKDAWKKRQSRHEKGMKDGDVDSDYDKERESSRRERERMDVDKIHERPAYRKDRGRMEGTKGASSYVSGNENPDTFAVRQKSIDCEREESGSSVMVRRGEARGLPDFVSGLPEEDWGYPSSDRTRISDAYTSGEDLQERYADDGSPLIDQNIGLDTARVDCDVANSGRGRDLKTTMSPNYASVGQTATGMPSPFGSNQGSVSYNRIVQQGGKVGRAGRGGRGRLPTRDAQRIGIHGPMMGNPFGPLGLPPGPMQPIGPNMSPAPGPPIGPGLYMPPFPAHIVWPGPRGVDMNMLPVPPGVSHVPPPGPSGPRYAPPIAAAPGHAMYFNQPGPVRGVSSNIPAPAFGGSNAIPLGRGMGNDKPPMGWVPPRSSGPPGKAPSRGEQNDYSQNFVDTGMRPQNFIRELELTNVVEDYPKLRELIQKKDEIVQKSASPPMYYKCDLKEHALSPEFFGTKFDVILVDPPWEEYVHRAPGVADHMEYWTFEEIQNLKIEAIADTPSFIFLWVGDGVGLEQGRLCLKKWGFRRCEDICWVKTNKSNATPGLRHDSHTLFQRSKEHCLMGIKGTVRRSTDGHIIHANIDTDIIIAEEPPYGSTAKPEDLYRIIEHFALGRRRIELFGEDHNIRAGWLTVGKGLTSSNFNSEGYIRNFADKDGKVWQGGGGRNPPPDAPHLVATTPEIENLRPKSPPQKNQQQQTSFISQAASSSSNKRATGNSPGQQNQIGPTLTPSPPGIGLNQEVSSLNVQGGIPWGSPLGIKSIETGNMMADDKFFENYGTNVSCGQGSGEPVDFDSQRTLNMM
ncbi:N6-adenosine-methyltransferase non-catalytic subunit MTB [Nymphaea colorata]|nr:N6-adenosine-methyltransferase non-catalytic subunit MTB [Nymphaea colorata]